MWRLWRRHLLRPRLEGEGVFVLRETEGCPVASRQAQYGVHLVSREVAGVPRHSGDHVNEELDLLEQLIVDEIAPRWRCGISGPLNVRGAFWHAVISLQARREAVPCSGPGRWSAPTWSATPSPPEGPTSTT